MSTKMRPNQLKPKNSMELAQNAGVNIRFIGAMKTAKS
jgi:hypothetical protein